jgi:hypothetical protein
MERSLSGQYYPKVKLAELPVDINYNRVYYLYDDAELDTENGRQMRSDAMYKFVIDHEDCKIYGNLAIVSVFDYKQNTIIKICMEFETDELNYYQTLVQKPVTEVTENNLDDPAHLLYD